ncbi:hypothetical protein FO488_12345 [Geobacter sp. FeAm09]|uniref:hypothetical protein n=1 Tax=Geobacter sp. FeAm09 TaxID=2597769 RepID=UPI0011EC766F|nr:hypothetical protein [Geobacter sp. FeAm09]QEM68868.1 hypothetical protein FO488_12345 [Geobacter sp. FeAm09]
MKRAFLAVLALMFCGGVAVAGGGLDGFLNSLNIQARADMNGFSAKVSAQFGVPLVQVRTIMDTVREPADAFMCLQLGQWTQKPPEQVVRVYKANQGKGWGVIAKSMGIKPGSAEFHALKRGDLTFSGRPAGDDEGQGRGKGKGHGKGHNK